MTGEQEFETWDQFPVGMRVLAVDDDQTCLRILKSLLHHCKYHVTTTNQAQTALELLRENKNKFDLVISDVDMPDMDGFKLLEHVGLEMDLPVIMLSAHSDPKYVMKGITHGACDYLLKPVRIEELKNIWQHVVRRRRSDKKNHNGSCDGRKDGSGNVSGNEAPGNSDNVKSNRKRKDQYEDEEDEKDENGRENDDPSAQKKPRVVWTVELHRKFVAAVNKLGIDKAVPKKILDLMDVDKLTRENVASHLQKYRLYLKRISCVANQQASMAAVLGSSDSHFLQMGSSLNGFGGFHRTMANGSGHFQGGGAGLRSFPPNGMLGRFNSSSGLGVRNLSSSGMFLQTATDIGKFQPISSLPASHTNGGGNIIQGLPGPLGLDQLQTNNKGIMGNSAGFSSFPVQNPLIHGSSNNLLPSPTGTPLNSGFATQFSGDPINGRLEHWPNAVSSTLPPANASQNGSSTNRFELPPLSSSGHPVHLQQSKPNDIQDWNTHNNNNNSMNYPILPFCDSLDTETLCTNAEIGSNGQQDLFDSLYLRQSEIVNPISDDLLSNNNMKEGFMMGQQKLQSGFMAGESCSLDDLVNSTMKQDLSQTDLTGGGGGDMGFGGFGSLRTYAYEKC